MSTGLSVVQTRNFNRNCFHVIKKNPFQHQAIGSFQSFIRIWISTISAQICQMRWVSRRWPVTYPRLWHLRAKIVGTKIKIDTGEMLEFGQWLTQGTLWAKIVINWGVTIAIEVDHQSLGALGSSPKNVITGAAFSVNHLPGDFRPATFSRNVVSYQQPALPQKVKDLALVMLRLSKCLQTASFVPCPQISMVSVQMHWNMKCLVVDAILPWNRKVIALHPKPSGPLEETNLQAAKRSNCAGAMRC